MARRTRIYVAFDADSDMDYYRLLQAWDANDGIDFDFLNAHELTTIRATSGEDAIRRSLRERMANSRLLVVLVGEKTWTLRKYVPWEIELAIAAGLPIIVVNLNGERGRDEAHCPSVLDGELAIHIPYGQRILKYAIEHWPQRHAELVSEGESGPRSYKDSVYESLGL